MKIVDIAQYQEHNKNKAETKTEQKPNNRGGIPGPRPKNEHGLTAKQEEFAQCVARGMTYSAAYKQAYNCENMKRESIGVNASKLADHPGVNDRIKALLEVRYQHSMLKDGRRVRQFVFDNLMEEVQREDTTASARLKALEMLGKVDVVGLFRERSEVEHTNNGTSEDLAETLKAKLKALMSDDKALGEDPSD